jgi:hypothetical protein
VRDDIYLVDIVARVSTNAPSSRPCAAS